MKRGCSSFFCRWRCFNFLTLCWSLSSFKSIFTCRRASLLLAYCRTRKGACPCSGRDRSTHLRWEWSWGVALENRSDTLQKWLASIWCLPGMIYFFPGAPSIHIWITGRERDDCAPSVHSDAGKVLALYSPGVTSSTPIPINGKWLPLLKTSWKRLQ